VFDDDIASMAQRIEMAIGTILGVRLYHAERRCLLNVQNKKVLKGINRRIPLGRLCTFFSFALKRSGLCQERRMIAFNLTLMDDIPSLY